MKKAAPSGRKEAVIMRQVDGGTFLNEPSIGRIAETLRQILNEGVAAGIMRKYIALAPGRKGTDNG